MECCWAPWRMEYILKDKGQDCFFCELYEENKDEDNLILWRGKKVFCIFNKYPYNSGHLMVAPAAHKKDIMVLDDDEMFELMKGVAKMKGVLERALSPEGFNIGINIGKVGGAGVLDHVHVHIVPRWLGDTNFMPICADTNVIGQHLSEMYAKLKNYIDQ